MALVKTNTASGMRNVKHPITSIHVSVFLIKFFLDYGTHKIFSVVNFLRDIADLLDLRGVSSINPTSMLMWSVVYVNLCVFVGRLVSWLI